MVAIIGAGVTVTLAIGGFDLSVGAVAAPSVMADNGRDAIRQVESDPEIQIVMMDIMMPEMDGLATMREIRKRPVGKALPIIAVTAKAMKGDREKCIEAGAWDYLSKPVNRDDLLAVLHAWLHR